MQRTYGRRALRRRSGILQRDCHEPDDLPLNDPSPPRKRRRGSIVNQMLGRSRTEPSLGAPSLTETPLVLASSVQKTLLAPSHSLPAMVPEWERETTPEASTESSPNPIPNQNIRTYAGSSRSFLLALPACDVDPLNAVEDDTEPHESYADLRTRWGIDMSEDMMNDLKSITELRSKGENRRFLDDVGYLFEGLDGSSAIGLRRAIAFEIVNKLCDLDFNRRAKTSDFYVRTWNRLWAARDGSSDKIFDITITFFAALAARDSRILTDVAQQKGFISTLVEILSLFDYKKDVLALALSSNSDDELKSYGIPRTEITALQSFVRLVSKESHLSSVNQPSARFFVSHSLATLPPSLLAAQHLPPLLVNLRTELSLMESRITAYESGFPLLPPTSLNGRDIPSFFHIEACLRLLDSYLLGHWSSANPAGGESSIGLSHMSGFTSELTSLCVASSSFLEETEGDIARKCLCGSMRVLTLLSYDDPWWCDAALEVSYALPFATMTIIRCQARWLELRNMGSQNSSVEVFDLLCLALGLVMNWATLRPEVAVLSRMKSINPTCPRPRPCVRACQCADQKSILECFTTLHVQYSDDYQDDPPECEFLRGYTAILLGLLIKDDASNQTIVLSTLPGTSPSNKIKTLIIHCTSFMDLYNDNTPLPSSDSPTVGVTHVVTDRHRTTWDKRGEDVFRSVIAALEILCDGT